MKVSYLRRMQSDFLCMEKTMKNISAAKDIRGKGGFSKGKNVLLHMTGCPLFARKAPDLYFFSIKSDTISLIVRLME